MPLVVILYAISFYYHKIFILRKKSGISWGGIVDEINILVPKIPFIQYTLFLT